MVRPRRQHGQIVALRAPLRDGASILHTALHDVNTIHDTNRRVASPTGPRERLSPAPPNRHRHSKVKEMVNRAIHSDRGHQGRLDNGPTVRGTARQHPRHQSDRANKHEAEA
nr:ORF7 [Chimpanzee stool associated circular ssDNA virus]